MQTILLEQIKQKNPEKPLATILSEILKISKDSAYRRIKNEIPLILPEVVKLCTVFDISLDQLIWLNQENKPNIKYFFSLRGNTIEETYVALLNRIIQIVDMGGTEARVFNLTEFIPFYYLSRHPHIRKLNYYIWKRTNMELDYTTPLVGSDMSPEIESLFDLLESKMSKMNMTWVLSPFWMKNILNNLAFFKKMKLITEDELAFYKEEFFALLDDMENEAGRSSETENTHILLSRVAFIGTTLLCMQKDKATDLILFYNTNILISTNPLANNEQREWIKTVCEKSLNISRGGILERKQFFENMRNQIDVCLSSSIG